MVPLYDTMMSPNVIPEKRDRFFTCTNLYCLKLLCDIQPHFSASYLRKVDRSSALVSEVYGTAHGAAEKIMTVDTPIADKFLNGLKIDKKGNLLVEPPGNHTLSLNQHHKCPRGQTYDTVLEGLKKKLSTLKEKVLQNIKGNIEDQCPDDSYFYSWSALDLCNKTSLEERQTRLTSVIELFCTEQLHTVSRYTNQKEEDIEPSSWEDFTVKINYPKKKLIVQRMNSK